MNDKALTGYASIDKPWLKYYSEEELAIGVPDMSLTDYLRRQNAGNLSLTALRYLEKRISYKELLERIELTSRYFQSLGVKEGDYVAVAMPLTPEAVYMMYGIENIGAIANLIDPRVPADRMRFYINLAKAKLGCVIDTFLNTMVDASEGSSLEKIISVSPLSSLEKAEQRRFLKSKFTALERIKLYTKALKTERELKRRNGRGCPIIKYEAKPGAKLPPLKPVAYKSGKASIVEYTSGTTGIPKGLELTASGMNVTAAQLHAINRTVPGESLLGILPPFISYGAVTSTHMSLTTGTELIMIPQFSLDQFDELIKKYKPNNVICVPSMFDRIIKSELLKDEDMSFLKRLTFGGDKTIPEFEETVNSWLNKHNAPIKLIKGGGMAEYSSCLFETPFDETKKPGIYGVPMPLVEAKIMKDDETECRYGEIGEIFVSSPQQMRGYVNNPEETEAFFHVDKNGKKWGRTGDLGFVDEDGAFTLTSRKKHMIIRPDGHNVFPSEIENAVMATGYAKACVVVGIKDKASVIGEYPVAFIELKPEYRDNAEAALKKIIQFVKDEIPVRDRPGSDEDYILSEIHYSSEGKIDRAVLVRKHEEINK